MKIEYISFTITSLHLDNQEKFEDKSLLCGDASKPKK